MSWQFRELAREMERRDWGAHFLDGRRQVEPGTDGIDHIHHWPGTGRPRGVPAIAFARSLARELRPELTVSNFVGVTPLGIGA